MEMVKCGYCGGECQKNGSPPWAEAFCSGDCWSAFEAGHHRPHTAKVATLASVSHPAYYGGDDTYEAIKVIEAWGLGFCLGNVVKYIARAGKKDPAKLLEDLKKAGWYLDRYIKSLEG